ncbi:MAG: heavy-metal-associated domain-containing protein [Bacteroidales bacterium]
MKNIVKAAALIFTLLLTFSWAGAQTQEGKNKNESQVLFSVEIDCASCKQKLEAKLPFEKGVKDLKIDLEEQTVWFLYDNRKSSKEALVLALKKLGYSAKELKPKGEATGVEKR